MRTGLLLVLTVCVLAGCADAQTPDGARPAGAAATEPVVVADGRAPWEGADFSGWSSPALPPALAAAGAHFRAADPSYEEESRVMDVAEGAFTDPGAAQQAVLYLMSTWPRCCPKMGIAVVQDGALVRNVVFEETAQDLNVVPDLDGDGLDELARIGSFGMGGDNSTSVTLFSFADAGLRTWGTTSIQSEGCAAMREGGEAARITAVPGPELTIERFTLQSCESGEWVPAGPPEPFELDPPGEESAVELPID